MKKLYLWYFITVFAVVCGADNTDDEDWEKYKVKFKRGVSLGDESFGNLTFQSNHFLTERVWKVVRQG